MTVSKRVRNNRTNNGGGISRARADLRYASLSRLIFLTGAVVFALAFSAIFTGLLIQDIASAGRISKGIKIAGIDIGGLTREEARRLMRKKLTANLEKPLILTIDSRQFKITAREIRLSINEEKMVESAYWAGRNRSIFERMLRRFLRRLVKKNIPVSIVYDRNRLAGRIDEIAASLNRKPVSASIDISKGYPIIRPSRYGFLVDEERTLNDVTRVLPTKERIVEIRASSITPSITEDEIGKIVVVKLSEHKLYLYDREKLIYEFKVAVGSPQYPTPTGKFYIIRKQKNPTWYPPKSDWAKGQKPIPPGPGNPLGPYWMEIGNGVGIHSTPDEASLGYSVSHGCIRVSEWGALQLFNAVSVGTPVFILP